MKDPYEEKSVWGLLLITVFAIGLFATFHVYTPTSSVDPLHHSTTEFDNCTLTIKTDNEFGGMIRIGHKDVTNQTLHRYAITGANVTFNRTFKNLNMVRVQYLKFENKQYTETGNMQEVLRC